MNVGHLGDVEDDVLRMIGQNTAPNHDEIIAEINIVLGERSLRRINIRGQILMLRPIGIDTYLKYDILVFSLIRDMFGLSFPKIATINYHHVTFIISKRFASRPLQLKDYWPNNAQNEHFRFQLGLIVFLCKLVGCSLQLSDVQVLDNFPFYWKCSSLGDRNCRSVSDEEFNMIFGVDIKKAPQASSSSSNSFFSNSSSKPVKLPITKVMYNVIQHLKACDFDTDILRGYLYLKEEPVRFAKGIRIKYRLSARPRVIENYIEQNYSILTGSSPLNLFI